MRTAVLKDLNATFQTPHHGTTLLNSPNACIGATAGHQVWNQHKTIHCKFIQFLNKYF